MSGKLSLGESKAVDWSCEIDTGFNGGCVGLTGRANTWNTPNQSADRRNSLKPLGGWVGGWVGGGFVFGDQESRDPSHSTAIRIWRGINFGQ